LDWFLLLLSLLKKEIREKEKLLSATRGVARIGQVMVTAPSGTA
jgi:hypothetical protein